MCAALITGLVGNYWLLSLRTIGNYTPHVSLIHLFSAAGIFFSVLISEMNLGSPQSAWLCLPGCRFSKNAFGYLVWKCSYKWAALPNTECTLLQLCPAFSGGDTRITRVSFPFFRGIEKTASLDQGSRCKSWNHYPLSVASPLLTLKCSWEA